MSVKNYKNYFSLCDHESLNNEFLKYCLLGDYKIVKYLLTTAPVKFQINIHIKNDRAIEHACQSGNLKVVKFLLTSPYLQDHSDIYKNKCEAFKIACELSECSSRFKENWMDIIDFLIFDFKIVKTQELENYLNEYAGVITKKAVEKFNLREIQETKKELNSILPRGKNIKKNKI